MSPVDAQGGYVSWMRGFDARRRGRRRCMPRAAPYRHPASSQGARLSLVGSFPQS
jgi:hypothetical protein